MNNLRITLDILNTFLRIMQKLFNFLRFNLDHVHEFA